MNLCQCNLFIVKFMYSKILCTDPQSLLHLLICYVNEEKILLLLQQLYGWKILLILLNFSSSIETIYYHFLQKPVNNHHSSILNHIFLIYVLYIFMYCYHLSILHPLLIYFYLQNLKLINNHSRLNCLFVHYVHQCFLQLFAY